MLLSFFGKLSQPAKVISDTKGRFHQKRSNRDYRNQDYQVNRDLIWFGFHQVNHGSTKHDYSNHINL